MQNEELERLKAQVKRAEERGQFDTCHHTMLELALKSEKGSKPKNAPKEGEQEKKING